MNNHMLGSSSHARYGHFHYPRVVALKCPGCGQQMIATNIDCPAGYEHFWDIDPYRGLWAAVCPHCGSGKEMNWEQMKDYVLWYKLILREEEVWAWNSSHLAFIIQKLEKKVDKAHPWASFEAYLKKSWLVKLSQERYVKKLRALL